MVVMVNMHVSQYSCTAINDLIDRASSSFFGAQEEAFILITLTNTTMYLLIIWPQYIRHFPAFRTGRSH